MSEVSHIAYRKIDGRDYVLVEKAEAELDLMADDALEVAARFVEKWGNPDDGLADAIRGLKKARL